MPKPDDRHRVYGTITVSERGQVAIPAEARRDFNIETGDKLLVLGDLDKGLWIFKASMLLDKMPGLFAILEQDSHLTKDELK